MACGFCRTPFLRVLVTIFLLLGQCPSFAASLIALAGTNGDHQLTLALGDHEIQVILGHRRDCDPSFSIHRHNPLETLFLGEVNDSEDHPDHHFRFSRTRALAQEADPAPAFQFSATSGALLPPTFLSEPWALPRPSLVRPTHPPDHPPETPATHRQGIVMRH